MRWAQKNYSLATKDVWLGSEKCLARRGEEKRDKERRGDKERRWEVKAEIMMMGKLIL